jgi:hypothetical protein
MILSTTVGEARSPNNLANGGLLYNFGYDQL